MFQMMVGKIDEVGGHFIGTEFFAFVGPLFPVRSMYVTEENFSRSGNRTTHSWEGIDIPINFKSVILGYLRVWLPIAAAVLPFVLMWGERVELRRPEYLISLALIVVWIFVLVVPGRLSATAKARAKVLLDVTGVGIDPHYLDAFMRQSTRDLFGESLAKADLSIADPKDFQVQLDSVPKEVVPMMYAYSEYAAADDSAWKPVAEAAWKQCEIEARQSGEG